MHLYPIVKTLSRPHLTRAAITKRSKAERADTIDMGRGTSALSRAFTRGYCSALVDIESRFGLKRKPWKPTS